MTYSEKNNRKPFDWNKFLSKTSITENQWEDARRLARSWVTCACGNQCSIIPRDIDGMPQDEMLRELGGDHGFYKCIQEHNATGALAILHLIEVRSSDLIKGERRRIREEVEKDLERIEDEKMRALKAYKLQIESLDQEKAQVQARLEM